MPAYSPQLVQDIDEIETASIDIAEIDSHMRDVADAVIFDFKKSKFYPDVRGILCDYIRTYVTTHTSIRRLIKVSIKEERPPILADALSLVREQVEKLYPMALFIQKPAKWLKQYLRNDWRKVYEEYLLNLVEHGHMPRFDEFLTSEAPATIEQMRRIKRLSGKGSEVLVSKLAMRMVWYNFHNHWVPRKDPATGRRQWPKYFEREKLKKYFEFPTPGASLNHINNNKVRSLLMRWYEDYQYLSTYSHISLGKIRLEVLSSFRDMGSGRKTEIYSEKKREYAVFTSYISFACACTMICDVSDVDMGSTHQLNKFWGILTDISLPAKVFWELYGRDVISRRTSRSRRP